MANSGKRSANTKGKGFRLFERPAQKNKPFCLQWNVALPGEPRRLKTKSFPTVELRAAKLESLVELREEQGKQALRIDVVKYQRWERLEAKAGKPLEEEVDFYLENVSSCPAVEVLAEEYFLARELYFRGKQKRIAMDTGAVQLRSTRRRVGNFVAAFKGVPADRVLVKMCRVWMQSLLRAYSPKTVVNFRTEVLMFYNHLIREGVLKENPMEHVKPPELVAVEHPFYSALETLRFFRVNELVDPEITGLVALSAFAGLRTSAVLRLRLQDIVKNPRGLNFAASGQKKSKRHFIQNYPENLWKWLEWMPKSALGMNEQVYYRRRTKALKRAGLAGKNNGWRHAFATHHAAWKQSARETAYLLQHRNQVMLWDTYKGNASQRNGRLYFQVAPRGELR